eukprot:CAMPEP_0204314046 /NCGR_PEP_ID=MMETSP0469-20131031/3981_1 /ASSEMBLY_ACC=CAM_ASM_000384 /TAXON_ID=2969 /ORGANISM="Oxyrrhis marina" /LENGTH=50 /DNA_ID=CAMNT_0051294469 /DNA_START=230 /DNA_END=378 /DNA_ORIENTATION=+
MTRGDAVPPATIRMVRDQPSGSSTTQAPRCVNRGDQQHARNAALPAQTAQ